jgi:hypothetical protein
MAYTYTTLPTVTQLDDLLASAGVSGLSASVDADLRTAYIDAAVAQIQKETRRQFVPGSAGEIRYYDGNGTGRLEIDEYIDITAVKFVLLPQSSSTTVTEFVEVQQQATPKTVLQIYRGRANYTTTYYPQFPEGRSNIEVTGQFGYASSIPADVYVAILKMAAAQLVGDNSIASGGGLMLKSWTNADRKEDYDTSGLASQKAGWDDFAKGVIRRYRKPLGTSLRQMEPQFY